MIAAKIPTDENLRLANLESYQIIDTAKDAAFDNLVKLMSVVCKVPVAAISFIDRDRQWIKAKVGIDLPNLESFPRELSVCAHVVASGEPLVVEDATLDERFCDHPLVTGSLKIRFYAGFPLISQEGYVLGAICMMDQQPRTLDDQQLQSLSLLNQQAVSLLERNRLQWMLEHQQDAMLETAKLAALGQMAAEIIHEINNPLAIIQARASFLALMGKKGRLTSESTIDVAKKIVDTSARITQIIKGVKNFSRSMESEPFASISLANLLDETLSFCMDRFKFALVHLERDPVPAHLVISCRSVQISQVLLNLLNNAIDAISHLEERWVKIQVKEHSDHIEIGIMDSGPGIDDKVLEKMFQPFFTTKGKGQGTGLGLSISKGIIENHQGTLTYDRSSSHTRFVITLPKTAQMLL